MSKFEMLCELLPADVNWGDAITPDVVEQIVMAEREACAELCEKLQKNHDRYYRTYEGKPYDPAHCAIVIRTRSKQEQERITK